MSIVIEPLGGLGNQLFVYGLGLRLARELKVELIVDTWRFRNYAWHVYELDTFRNSISFTRSTRLRERYAHKSRYVIRGAQRIRLLPKRIGHLVMEQGTTFDPMILGVPDGTRLSGYFQSWRYFDAISESLCQEISSPIDPSAWMQITKNQLDKLGDWTAIHIRRGNYVTVSSMGLVDETYYARAIREIDLRVGKLPLVVFSDSPELVENISILDPQRTTFISTPPEVRAIDVLQVMSEASHLIIGNSTFSWWAAYLRDRVGRIVIAPRPWLDDLKFDSRDLLLPDWITLGRSSISNRSLSF